jgi:FemAB-related protein (PEP-CTERM system-associated)
MQIRLYKPSDRSAWDNYVAKHADGTFFHLSGWKEVVEKSFGHKAYYLMAIQRPDSNIQYTASSIQYSESSIQHPASSIQKIVGLFPLFSIKSILFGRSMISLPFATYGGILADSDEVEDALYKEGVALTTAMALDYLEIRSETHHLSDLPVKDLYCGFKRELSADNAENLQAVPRKTRRMVRKGISNDLKATFGTRELLDQFYGLFAFSYHGFGTPVFSKGYLRKTLEEFQNDCSILIVSKNGRPLAGVLSFYFEDHVIPYYSGAYPDSRKYAANDYLYWALMSDAVDRGFRVFDFGRSKKDTGPFHFKRHWGFEPRSLPYQYYLNNIKELPNISPANPKYKKRIELWKKLPFWATKLIGPRIVKYIP